MLIRILTILLVLVAAVFNMGLQGCGATYPSYAGVYKLVKHSYAGHGSNPDDATDGTSFPFVINLPKEVEVYQHNLTRNNGVVHNRLVMLSKDPSIPGVIFNQSDYWDRINENNSTSRILTKEYNWEDYDSPELWYAGQYEGHACRFDLGASVSFKVSPATWVLTDDDQGVYPLCENTKVAPDTTLCVRSQHWTDMPVDFDKWEKEKVQIDVVFSAHKKIALGLADDCVKPSYESRLYATYERVEAYDMGDLRTDENPAGEAMIEEALKGKASALYDIFQVPKDGGEIISSFPNDPWPWN